MLDASMYDEEASSYIICRKLQLSSPSMPRPWCQVGMHDPCHRLTVLASLIESQDGVLRVHDRQVSLA